MQLNGRRSFLRNTLKATLATDAKEFTFYDVSGPNIETCRLLLPAHGLCVSLE